MHLSAFYCVLATFSVKHHRVTVVLLAPGRLIGDDDVAADAVAVAVDSAGGDGGKWKAKERTSSANVDQPAGDKHSTSENRTTLMLCVLSVSIFWKKGKVSVWSQ